VDGNFVLVSLIHSQLQEILPRPSVNYIKKRSIGSFITKLLTSTTMVEGMEIQMKNQIKYYYFSAPF
jgi:hypothetical protein